MARMPSPLFVQSLARSAGPFASPRLAQCLLLALNRDMWQCCVPTMDLPFHISGALCLRVTTLIFFELWILAVKKDSDFHR